MKQSRKVAVLAMSLLFALPLLSCGTQSGQALSAIHTSGELERYSNMGGNPCLYCHDLEGIAEPTKDYGGQNGLNIHQPPADMAKYFGDCQTCHQVDEPPVITCNQCHDFRQPPGWTQ